MSKPVDIPDELWVRLEDKYGPSQLGERFATMIERELRDPDIDALTGCRSKQALEYDILIAVDRAARDRKRYIQSFLCCDVDNFTHFVDYHGFGHSDQLLIQLADRLKSTAREVYRYGGDEFIVMGQKLEISDLSSGLGVNVRQSIVDVDLPVDVSRRKRVKSWIMFYLHRGLVQPELLGERIFCREHDAWHTR